jgi:hypothetical protein
VIPAEVIAEIRKHGATLDITPEGRLRIEPWKSLPLEIRAAVREHRDDLRTLLQAERRKVSKDTSAIGPTEYAAFGLYVVDGVVTHALGDHVAADILAGRISRARAEEMQQQAERSADGLANARTWRPSYE